MSGTSDVGRARKIGGRVASAARGIDANAKLITAVKLARELLPGDAAFGDPLSTAGREQAQLAGRRLAELTDKRPGLLRETGLTALQLWQALGESQGRGRGTTEMSIAFTDLVDFSRWALDAGDDAVLALLRDVANASERPIEEHGGQVVKRLGDGLMAVFAEAADAVRAAHAACDEVGQVEVEGDRPRLRAGVHTGRPRRIGGDYVGVDVNIAARVAESAKGHEVLVSAAACEELDQQSFRLRRKRFFRAKGTPQGLEVCAVAPEAPS